MKKVCVIGAGASGIAAAKVLHERNVPFDVYQRRCTKSNNGATVFTSVMIKAPVIPFRLIFSRS